MKHFWLIPIAFVALVIPVAVLAGGGETGFDAVVHSIENRYHVEATRIPFMGLVSLIARGATHNGAGGLHLAEFDNFTEPVDGQELNALVERKIGPGWELMIRETHRKSHDQTLIYSRPEGNQMSLFILDLDGHEMDVVQVSVDPDHLNASIGQYKHHSEDEGDGGASN